MWPETNGSAGLKAAWAQAKAASAAPSREPVWQMEEDEDMIAGDETAATGDPNGPEQYRYRLCGVILYARSVAVISPRTSSVTDGEQLVPFGNEWVWFLSEFNGLGASIRVSFTLGSSAFRAWHWRLTLAKTLFEDEVANLARS